MITSPSEAGRRSGIVRSSFQTRRDQSIVALRAMGRTVPEIAKRLGIHERAVYKALRRAQPAQAIIAEELAREAVNGDLILTRLSDMFNADIGDIIEPAQIPNPDVPGDMCSNPRAGSYRPIHEWPAVWRRMLSGSEVKELFEHSKDGEGASWDKIGELVKIKFIDPLKLIELAMKHKGVNAMVEQGSKLGQGLSDLANAVNLKTVVDLASICTPEQLEQLRMKALEAQNPSGNLDPAQNPQNPGE